MTLQQTAQSTLPTTSMSMSGSGHGSGPGYSHSGPSSQSVPLQGQGAISNYVSRANINMQSNPGNAPPGPSPRAHLALGPSNVYRSHIGCPARHGLVLRRRGVLRAAPLELPRVRGW